MNIAEIESLFLPNALRGKRLECDSIATCPSGFGSTMKLQLRGDVPLGPPGVLGAELIAVKKLLGGFVEAIGQQSHIDGPNGTDCYERELTSPGHDDKTNTLYPAGTVLWEARGSSGVEWVATREDALRAIDHPLAALLGEAEKAAK